jgi:saccharopine dehydrogenase-like NADP-dependent oxidoreductase
MAPSKNILVIGAGELGNQVLRFVANHPQRQGAVVSVLLRPATIASTNPEKKNDVDGLRALGIQLVGGDVAQDTEQRMSSTFAGYDTIISCM